MPSRVSPMTDFRRNAEPPRLQWRYRSGFSPDSLFSHKHCDRICEHSNGYLLVYKGSTVKSFCQPLFQRKFSCEGCERTYSVVGYCQEVYWNGNIPTVPSRRRRAKVFGVGIQPSYDTRQALGECRAVFSCPHHGGIFCFRRSYVLLFIYHRPSCR